MQQGQTRNCYRREKVDSPALLSPPTREGQTQKTKRGNARSKRDKAKFAPRYERDCSTTQYGKVTCVCACLRALCRVLGLFVAFRLGCSHAFRCVLSMFVVVHPRCVRALWRVLVVFAAPCPRCAPPYQAGRHRGSHRAPSLCRVGICCYSSVFPVVGVNKNWRGKVFASHRVTDLSKSGGIGLPAGLAN